MFSENILFTKYVSYIKTIVMIDLSFNQIDAPNIINN